MDLIQFGEKLSRLLPKIKTKLQLSGLALGFAFALSVRFAKPGDNLALITAGSVGISLIIFGQIFHFLKDFSVRDRPKVFLISFALFCVFTLSLLIITGLLLRKPTISIMKYDPPPEIEEASRSFVAVPETLKIFNPALTKEIPQAKNESVVQLRAAVRKVFADYISREVLAFGILRPYSARSAFAVWVNDYNRQSTAQPRTVATGGPSREILALPESNTPRDAEYAFSEERGVPTLKAIFLYTVDSRKSLYPDADFHNDVSWGSPWLSFNIANPTNAPLFFTSLKTEALGIKLINDVILNVPSLISATPESAELTLINEGWGKANNPTLEIRFARPIGDDRYIVVGKKDFTLRSFDERAVVDLGPALPPFSEWHHLNDFKAGVYCKADGYLLALGRLRYLDEAGVNRIETFRTSISQCGGGGGNVGPSAYFNINLPHEKDAYPIYMAVSSCIAPKSADQLVVKLTAKRSVHLRLKFTLASTSGSTVERVADVDILVPRNNFQHTSRDGQFFKDASKDGCT